MSWTIRDFTTDDYEAAVAIHNGVYPEYLEAAANWRRWDSLREPRQRQRRWLAEADGRVVGLASYSQSVWSFHPRKFSVDVMVLPEFRRAGIGAALWERVEAALAAFDPIVYRAEVEERREEGLRFAAARGFAQTQREQESHLDIAAFEPGRFAADLARVDEQGIAIKSLVELEAEDPEARRKYHALGSAVGADVPMPDPHTEQPFDVWEKRIFESPNLVPECHLVAVDGDRWVGLSNLWKEETPGRLETGLTGVLRGYRKRGLATALKVRAIAAAKALGYERTLTWNEERNQGMLGINYRLGFVPGTAWLELGKVLDEDALAETMAEAEPAEKS